MTTSIFTLITQTMAMKMKWFKHYSDATNSLKLSSLLNTLGAEGYGFYWLFLELVSSKFDGSFEKVLIHPDEVLQKFRLNNRRKMVGFVKVLNELSLIDVQTEGKLFQIDTRILVKLKQKNFKCEHFEGTFEAQKVPLELEENKNKKRVKRKKALTLPLSQNSELKNLVKESLSFIDSDELELLSSGSVKAMRYILERYELEDIERYFYQVTDYNNNNPKKAKKDIPSTMRNWMEKARGENKIVFKEDYQNVAITNIFTEALESND